MIVSPTDTTPTIMGLIAIGKNPQDFMSGARIQFLRIDGFELADPVIDEENIGGAIVEQLRRIEEKLKAHNRTSVDVTSSAIHGIVQPYPLAAIHQIVYNAVLHRTYERTNTPIRVYWFNDRIEITSPGGPYGNVTVENFGQPGVTDYRNPNIGDILKTFGYVQAFGRGIEIARRKLKENQNPELSFDVNQSTVQCTIRRNP
jgi:ATP-dependent DNA helicase RecG